MSDYNERPPAPHYFTQHEYVENYVRHEEVKVKGFLEWICKLANYILGICEPNEQMLQQFRTELENVINPGNVCDEHASCENGYVTGPGSDPNCGVCIATYSVLIKNRHNIENIFSTDEVQEELCKARETTTGKNACKIAVGSGAHLIGHLNEGKPMSIRDFRRICQSIHVCR